MARFALHMCSRVGVGSRRWSSRFSMEIMPSTRWENGWKSAGWWHCCSRGSRMPRCMITGEGAFWMRCLRRISTTCVVLLRSRRWRCMPFQPHGCIRTLRPLCSMGPMRMNRKRHEPPDPLMGIAKTAVPISSRCSSVLGSGGMEAYPCASASEMVSAQPKVSW